MANAIGNTTKPNCSNVNGAGTGAEIGVRTMNDDGPERAKDEMDMVMI